MNGKITLSNKLKGAVTMANTIINGGASPYPKSASGDIITITDGAENTPLKSAVVNIEPVQSGSGDPSPTNIRPISGRTEVVTQRTGVNVWDEEWELGIFNNTTGQKINNNSNSRSKNYISVLPSTQYYFKSTLNSRFFFYKADKTFISTQVIQMNTVLITPSNASYMMFQFGSTTYNNDISINYPSTDHAYHAYNGAPITTPLGRTVYGGTLDVVKGKMTITDVGIDMGSIAWSYTTTGSKPYFRTTSRIADILPATSSAVIQPILSSRYKPESWSHVIDSTGYDFCICVGWENEKFVAVTDSTYTNANAFTTAVTGQTLVYRLATPIEVDLTPQTIKTLLGTNNIWADAGKMSIEYYPAAASIVAVQNRSTKAYVSIPLGMIRYETYQITPQQTIDLDSYRSENGNLLRNPVATKCKLEFNTPLMTDTQWAEIWNIIKAGFNNNTERKLKLKYYDTLSATYKTGYFYVPDVQTTIRNIEEGPGVINYQEIRLSFIEY